MFTIQYVGANGTHEMQTFDSRSRERLVNHLARFPHPIVAVYEQASPITKTVRKLLAERPFKSNAALKFVTSPT